VDPRAGLDTEATGKILSPLPGIEPRSLGRPVSSQALYCLSYPAHSSAATSDNYELAINYEHGTKLKPVIDSSTYI
jgi:hypothetical protein